MKLFRDANGHLVKVRITDTGWLLSYQNGPTVAVSSKNDLEATLKGSGPR